MFGCAWKINFSEITFNWLGVLKDLTWKWFEVKIFTSNHFWTHTHTRARARTHTHTHTKPSTSTLPIYEPTDLRTDHAFDFADLWTHESIFNLEPSTHEPSTSPVTKSLRTTNGSSTQSLRPRATNPRIDLSLCVILIFCVILIDPRTNEPLISDFYVVVVVVWVVVFWWFSYCVVVGFVWVVVENSIFRMLPNTWKYFLKQFS